MVDTYDEADLIARLRSGDRKACDECIEAHSPAVFRQALRLVGDEAEAEDVMQETFLNAFKAIEGFEGRSGLGTWLYRITYNTAMMRLRRTNPHTISVEETLAFDPPGSIPQQLFDWCCLPEEEFESDEVQDELGQAIGALPDTLKGVFVLRELEGLSTGQTAVALDLSEGAVKVRLHRARLWLRERLSPYFGEFVQEDRVVVARRREG